MAHDSLSNSGTELPKEPSCKIISKSMPWLRRRSCLKVFLFLAPAAILFNGAEWFEQFWQIVTKEHSCEIISKIFSWIKQKKSLKAYFYF